MDISRFEYHHKNDFAPIKQHLGQRGLDAEDVQEKVSAIIEDVRKNGDSALVEYTRAFDCAEFELKDLQARKQDLKAAAERVEGQELDYIREAISRVKDFHCKQKENSWFDPCSDGSVLGQMNIPVQSAGLYVPGGRGGDTPLVSSLIMTAIPALVAGVKEISIVSPPDFRGKLNEYIMATAYLLGINKVFCCGSAWSIAALAGGTETVPSVDVIAGPGNIFVSTAKRLVSGRVGIDMIAGPSEIAILADGTADAEWLAADMLSQAEHDALAASILVCTQDDLLEECFSSLQRQIGGLSRGDTAQRSLENCGAFIKVPDLDKGMELINCLAPEHFELCVESPWEALGSLQNAGAVFLGHYSPEPVGDYFAGPNHVLPTLATSRFSSALSVDFFTKKTSILATSRAYLEDHGVKIAGLARLEGLEAHARSVEVRTKGNS